MDQKRTIAPAPPDHQLPPAETEPGHSKKKWWIWAVAVILVCLILYLIFRHGSNQTSQSSAGAAGGRHAFTGPVTLTTATATKGDIGVYLDAIGTVTALYTDSITAQVTGVIQAVHYKEGQLVRKGAPLIDIDARPYEAQVIQAEGALERDQNLLAQAQMDLQRYKEAWARNAIPRQTLEDQEKIVLQDQGTVKNDQGTLRYDQVQVAYCHITTDQRPGGAAAGGPGKSGDGERHDDAGGDHRDATNHGGSDNFRGQSCGSDGPAPSRDQSSAGCVGPRQSK